MCFYLPLSRGKGVSSIGLPWERNWDELCDRFCLAFLTDFRENPSTLSTEGAVVAAEDIALVRETQEEGGGGGEVTLGVLRKLQI